MKAPFCQNSAAIVMSIALYGMGARASCSGPDTPAVPFTFISFTMMPLLPPAEVEAPHRHPWNSMLCFGGTVTSSTIISRKESTLRGRRGGEGLGKGEPTVMGKRTRDISGSSPTTWRFLSRVELSRQSRGKLWEAGNNRASYSYSEEQDGGNDDEEEEREKKKFAEDDADDESSTMPDFRNSGGGREREMLGGPGQTRTLASPDDSAGATLRSFRAWLPRFFPPTTDRDQSNDEKETAIRPLVELPLDGALLQLIPALLIAVLGLFLTVAIQVEAGRFDGMVGEDGEPAAVVVTDLRETGNAAP